MLSDDVIITGKRAIARSYAKINLTLDVLGKREDGYHNVRMIMQTVSLYDLLIIDKTFGSISMKSNLSYLPDNEKNIAFKAARLFFEYTGIHSFVKIMLHKNIPVAAGLAGGSGNAAAVLCAMDRLYGTNIPTAELMKLGASLGADVPYCMIGGTALASEKGDILERLEPMPKAYVLVVKPPISISTAEAYEKIDSAEIIAHPDTDAVIKAVSEHDLKAISGGLCNVMETVAEKEYPIITGIKRRMIHYGALGALMSGTGPTVFGIFDDYTNAKRTHDSFSRQFKDVFLVSTI